MSSTEIGRAEELLRAAGVEGEILGPLAQYTALLLKANAAVNLTGAKSLEELVPHVLDSLSVVSWIAGPYIDVGSGGGLPGIPVAIATEVETTLLEPIAKKAAFLRSAVAELGLNATVDGRRAEEAGRDPGLREHFASATIRAVASASAALELTAPFLAIGGVAILQRGEEAPGEKVALEDAAPMLGCHVESERSLEGKRRLVLLRKIAATPERFPRRTGIAQKRPLCG